jgi:hypothetical protein
VSQIRSVADRQPMRDCKRANVAADNRWLEIGTCLKQ